MYLAGFTFAYLRLDAGAGALIVFGTVQMVMFGAGWRAGERLGGVGWTGGAVAISGLVLLLAPGAAAPSPLAAMLMVLGGVGWAVYSLLGRGSRNPLRETAINFVAASPLVFGMWWLAREEVVWSAAGVLLAVASGSLASGLGYAVWYSVLPRLGTYRAAIAQLSVPIIASLAGV